MKKTVSALSMIVAMVFSVMLFTGTTSKAAAWTAGFQQTDADTSSVKLQWAAHLDADYYGIEFSYDGASWSEMEWTTSTSDTVYSLTAGSRYYVKIIAYSGYHGSGTKLAESEVIDVVTASSKVQNVYQSDATTNSVTMSWDKLPGVAGYGVYRYNGYGDYKALDVVTTNSYKYTGLSASSEVKLFVVGINQSDAGFLAIGDPSDWVAMHTAPAKVPYVSITSYYSTLGQCQFGWPSVNYVSGYQFQLQDYKGKNLINKETQGTYMSVSPYKQGVFTRARCRAYVLVDGKKIYGAWSGYMYSAGTKNGKVIRSANRKKITVKFPTIKGASAYRVYVSTKRDSGYKKIKQVKAGKKSYSFTKFKGKKLQKNKTYYVRIKYVIKVGKKDVVSAIEGTSSI